MTPSPPTIKHLKNPEGVQHFEVGSGEVLEIHMHDTTPGNRTCTVSVHLVGEGAQCRVMGRAQTSDRDEKYWNVNIIAQGENQKGHLELRGTAQGQSCLHFDGGATLAQSSTDGDMFVSEKILLFEKSRGKCLPVLRVETDRVSAAAHEATVSGIDPEKLLYLRSRGIPEEAATTLMKNGFLALDAHTKMQ